MYQAVKSGTLQTLENLQKTGAWGYRGRGRMGLWRHLDLQLDRQLTRLLL